MSFARDDVVDACRRWGGQSQGVGFLVPAGIDGPQLLWALSGCESSFGANCVPRHEMAYCTGVYSHNARVMALTEEFQCAAHCSYGPWQLMLINASAFTKPEDFTRLDRCAMETVSFINTRILKGEGAKTVEQIADAYNSGTWRDKYVPAQYIAQCRNYYEHELMPSGTSEVVA